MRSNKVVLIFSLLVLLGHGKKSDGNGKGILEILTILQITNHSFPECGSKRPCAESHYDRYPKSFTGAPEVYHIKLMDLEVP